MDPESSRGSEAESAGAISSQGKSTPVPALRPAGRTTSSTTTSTTTSTLKGRLKPTLLLGGHQRTR